MEFITSFSLTSFQTKRTWVQEEGVAAHPELSVSQLGLVFVIYRVQDNTELALGKHDTLLVCHYLL